jgi:hypothetical protein
VSLIAAVAGILSKLSGWAGTLFLGAASGTIVSLWILWPAILSSYRYKRSLFLRDAGLIDRRSPEEQKSARTKNTYALEDNLFKMLHRGKRRETEVDKLTSTIELGLLTYTAIGITIWVTDFQILPVGIVAVIGLLIFSLASWWASRKFRFWL